MISKGSKKWATALDFLEWYGIPLMPGFGIVIVDNLHKDKYTKISPDGEDCFNFARALSIGTSLIASMVLLMI